MLLFEAHSELLHRHLRLWRALRHPGSGRPTHGKAYAGEKDSKVNGTHSGQVWSLHTRDCTTGYLRLPCPLPIASSNKSLQGKDPLTHELGLVYSMGLL